MKFLSFNLAWLAGFALFGAAAMIAFGFVVFPHPAAVRLIPKLGGVGLEFGLNLFVLAFCFAALRGARRPEHSPQAFGLTQGIWGIAGFVIVLAGGGVLMANVLTIANFSLVARHSPARIDVSGQDFLISCFVAGEVLAAFWVAWYFRRQGLQRLADGSPAGLAWRAAPPRAYLAASLCALGLIGLVVILFHAVPPDTTKLETLPMAKLFSGSGISMLPVLFIAVFLAPALEEMVFRGVAFAGFAARLGPLWAGAITTLAFMAAHAPEKIYYPPGFIDIGLMAVAAVWLRLKYRSIRPCILLHILYNAGSMLAAALMP